MAQPAGAGGQAAAAAGGANNNAPAPVPVAVHPRFLPANKAICCVVCGIPVLPTVDNALTPMYAAEDIAWMKPLLLRPVSHDLIEAVKPAAFVGGGDGFRVRVVSTNDDDDDDDNTITNVDGTQQQQQTQSQTQSQTQVENISLTFGSSPANAKAKAKAKANADNHPIPLHVGCHTIAQHFCTSQSRFRFGFRDAADGAPATIAQLWEIWHKRLLMTPFVDGWSGAGSGAGAGGIVNRPVFEPHRYLGAPRVLNLAVYKQELMSANGAGSRYTGPQSSRLEWFQADPVAGCRRGTSQSSVTAQIVFGGGGSGLSLCRIPAGDEIPDLEMQVVMARIERELPLELKLKVERRLEPFVNESLHCTRVCEAEWWKDMLFDGHAIPWLWDLNFEEVRAVRIEQGIDLNDEKGWDWELLVRELSQTTIFEEGGLLHHASPELWNRHRIWTLLNKARLAHLQYVS